MSMACASIIKTASRSHFVGMLGEADGRRAAKGFTLVLALDGNRNSRTSKTLSLTERQPRDVPFGP